MKISAVSPFATTRNSRGRSALSRSSFGSSFIGFLFLGGVQLVAASNGREVLQLADLVDRHPARVLCAATGGLEVLGLRLRIALHQAVTVEFHEVSGSSEQFS